MVKGVWWYRGTYACIGVSLPCVDYSNMDGFRGGGIGGARTPSFPKKYYTFMFSLTSPKVTLPLPRPPFSKILDPPLYITSKGMLYNLLECYMIYSYSTRHLQNVKHAIQPSTMSLKISIRSHACNILIALHGHIWDITYYGEDILEQKR